MQTLPIAKDTLKDDIAAGLSNEDIDAKHGLRRGRTARLVQSLAPDDPELRGLVQERRSQAMKDGARRRLARWRAEKAAG